MRYSFRKTRRLFFPLFVIGSLVFLSSCSEKKQEDRIIYDLNENFDPNHEGDTDWNYTEIDEYWMEEADLYYDSSIGEIRQKAEYDKTSKKHSHKPMNPITGRIIQLIAVWLAMNGFLLYGAYVQAKKLHRRTFMWMCNCFIGGMPTFIVLSLAPALKFNKDLEFREEPDLLGMMMFFGNLSVVVMVYIVVSTYFMMVRNPEILIDFVGK